MFKSLFRLWAVALMLFLMLFGVMASFQIPVGAQVVLKPNGQNAIPLRSKSIHADVTVDHQVATTHLTLTFQNETSQRIEADFIYTMPPDSLVTSFAYWCGSEKVIARVMEKEEAASIYKHITTRMNDPALVEMIGKNTFRARIFPVMPNSDLKVEMNLVRALPSDAQGAVYTFPLKAQKGDTLDSIVMNIHVKPDADVTQVTNANGLPVRRDALGYHMTLRGTNYRPQQDLRVNLVRPPRPLIAALCAAPSTSGRDGFFALSVTPDRTMIDPKITVEGITTYDVIAAKASRISAYHALRLFGRYRGSGRAKVTLTGTVQQGRITLSHPVVFGAQHTENNPATKLWAARRMEQLSENDENRETVIALSKRFGMPSQYTSWLAVPKEEMARYEKEIAAAKITVVARQLAAEMAANPGRKTRRSRELRAQFDHWRRIVGAHPDWAVSYSLSHDIENIMPKLVQQIEAHKENGVAARSLRIQLQLLIQVAGQDSSPQLASYMQPAFSRLAEQLVDARHADTVDYHKTEALTREFHRLEKIVGQSEQNYLNEAENNWKYRFSEQLVSARHAEIVDKSKVAALTRILHRFEKTSGRSIQQDIEYAERNWKYREIENLRDKLYAEQQKDHPDTSKVKNLEERFVALHDREAKDDARKRAERIRIHTNQAKLARQIASSQHAGSEDLALLMRKKAELDKRDGELRARWGDPLIRIDAPADAQQVIALMPGGEIKRLVYDAAVKQWEARFDIPMYAAEGVYEIKVIIVFKDGTRRVQIIRYHVDVTPPTASGHALAVVGEHPMLRLELEEASDDTARVKALLPWGETVRLQPSAQPHHFFALVPIPTGQQSGPLAITYIVTDRAHNRTTIKVDMTR